MFCSFSFFLYLGVMGGVPGGAGGKQYEGGVSAIGVCCRISKFMHLSFNSLCIPSRITGLNTLCVKLKMLRLGL